jgi:hypothetical protein
MAFESSQEYIGNELQVFSLASNWGKYLRSQIIPYLSGTVIEVGAGIGTKTKELCGNVNRYIAVEPDPTMYQTLLNETSLNIAMDNVECLHGVINDVTNNILADAVIYIDVLEHIESDKAQLELALSKIRPGGYLVVLSPAHQWLYTEFDRAIGHYRRYDRKSLLEISPPDSKVVCNRMLDSCGMLASLGNRLFLNNSMPSKSQILLWDRVMVPISRYLDRLTGFFIGKSILVVWQKNSD